MARSLKNILLKTNPVEERIRFREHVKNIHQSFKCYSIFYYEMLGTCFLHIDEWLKKYPRQVILGMTSH